MSVTAYTKAGADAAIAEAVAAVPAGRDGATINAAPGAPSGEGNAGDLYIDTDTGDLYRFSI